MTEPQQFYIIKRMGGSCDILPAQQLEQERDPTSIEKFGPFNSLEEAIARRVGLIRAGKCQPQ